MLKGIYLLAKGNKDLIYGPEEQRDIEKMIDISPIEYTPESIIHEPSLLHDVDIIMTGWGSARMDSAFLAKAPRLKAIFYGAGSIKGVATDAMWDREIVITSAYAANGVPVAEYTLSQILFSLKRGWHLAFETKRQGKFADRGHIPGGYGSVVGIISLGMIGRRVCELLKPFDISVIAYDPFVSKKEADALDVELCPLDEIFERADVVSLHTPWLKETENMIRGRHFASMKPSATFINTSRGAVVCEGEMISVLEQRPDIYAVLDVTYPEPPVPGSSLYTLPNVILTPHIAGSIGKECNRMGRYMVEELERYLKGEPLHWAISRERAKIMA